MSQYRIKKPVRLYEFFSGIGAQSSALERLGVDYEVFKTSDWDVNSVKSYKAIHCSNDNTDYSAKLTREEIAEALIKMCISNDGKAPMTEAQIKKKNEKWQRDTYNDFRATNNLGSITEIHAEDLQIDNENYENILFYSFPCTDISNAGLQKGFKKGTATRSSMLWQVERILDECNELNCLPKILMMENVAAIHNKKNMDDFQMWLDTLSNLGYKSFWQDLSSKDYGVGQSRLRCFCISILTDSDEDEYIFPEPIPLEYRLKDYLEDKVDEKYYIDNEKADKLIEQLIQRGVLPFNKDKQLVYLSQKATCFDKEADIACALLARDWKGPGNQMFNMVIEEAIDE